MKMNDILRKPTALLLLYKLICNKENRNVYKISKELNITYGTAHNNLKLLEHYDLIFKQRIGRISVIKFTKKGIITASCFKEFYENLHKKSD